MSTDKEIKVNESVEVETTANQTQQFITFTPEQFKELLNSFYKPTVEQPKSVEEPPKKVLRKW